MLIKLILSDLLLFGSCFVVGSIMQKCYTAGGIADITLGGLTLLSLLTLPVLMLILIWN